MKLPPFAALVGTFLSVLGLSPDTLLAGLLPATGGDCVGVDVRGRYVLTNNTNQPASDLEFTVFAPDGPSIFNGVSVNSTGFTTGMVNAHDGQGDVTLDGGVVPVGGTITVTIDLWLKKQNSQAIALGRWTDPQGNPIGVGGPLPMGGFGVGDPKPGGNGGNPGNQGGGGGAGNFVHTITFFDNSNKDVALTAVKFFASTTTYSDLSLVPWNTVPLITDLPNGGVIPANGTLTYDFNTTGGYFGGHIYLDYVWNDAPILVMGDHPVPTPEPASLTILGTGAVSMLGGSLLRRRSSRA